MTTPVRRTADEVGRLGDAIYERDIRSQVEKTHHGKIVAIDVDSGDYSIGENVIAATERLLAQDPNADIWCVKVGYRALRSFGAGSFWRSG
ncbi:MAG: hypothetical protein OXI03_10850 [Chloroflexota bacterium]|nr:hypothetical protein [Chloroflexota bacterium]